MTKIQAASPQKKRTRGGVEAARARSAIWFLIPALIAIALVAGYPLFKTFYYSFTESNISDPASAKWIGLGNYWFTNEDGVGLGVLQDPGWWAAVWNTIKFSLVSVSLELVLGLGIAMVLNSKFRGRTFMRTAMLVPWAIPTVVSAQMWAFMYNDSFGLLGTQLGAVLADTNTAIWAIVAVDVWKTTPFMALLLLAGLQGLSADVYEAADVDGASKWTQFWRITLPLLKPTILVALVFRTLDALRVFDVMYVMMGPNKAAEASMTAYARLNLIDNQLLGYGSAVSVVIFLIIMAFTVMYVTSLKVRFD
ncbi:carbohydrate ABC transporter permease [Deinococcus misasensis]|uniref:carbohydrate ABC transporter permease n=1 Tax=Deinococcus misasensis TaxID=392413 RepID=UPI0005559FE6|nr:sugar ABC transporter permease [Deinococcus misasensis]